MPGPIGGYDDVIRDILNKRRSKYDQLRDLEAKLEGRDPVLERQAKNPLVLMEPGKTAEDYPKSDKYTYIAPSRRPGQKADITDPITREDVEFMREIMRLHEKNRTTVKQRDEEQENVMRDPRFEQGV